MLRSRVPVLNNVGDWRLAIAMCFLAAAPAFAQNTNISIGTTPLQSSVKPFGMNLGTDNNFDSGQMTKNLIFMNPGFEGGIYRSTIRCASGTSTTCTDDDPWEGWPSGYWNGATFEFFYGAAQGLTGTITSYTAPSGSVGGTFTFSTPGIVPAAGDYMIVRKTMPGNATQGWWTYTTGNGAVSTNFSDLPPATAGTQTAVLTAPGNGDSVTVASFFDSTIGKTFVQLNGTFQLSFKAKGTGGANTLNVSVIRSGVAPYLNQTVSLTNNWATYNLTFNASETGTSVGTVSVEFVAQGPDSAFLDDVSLVQTNTDPSNPTVFRDPVVAALKAVNPGTLRFWSYQLGDSLDNLISNVYGRQLAGYSAFSTTPNDVSYGLYEFLQLCETIGADPWFVVPSTFSTTEAANLIEYLAASSSTVYGAKRAAQGHPAPWINSFSKIHLEFGNEAWNSTFKGGSIEYPIPYGQRAQAIFAAMRADSTYVPSAFDLVLGGQAVWPGRNQTIQDNCDNNDSFTIGPYLMNTVDSYSTNELLFGSTFAEPEAYISPNGTAEGVTGGLIYQNQLALQNSSHPVPLVVYETNMSTLAGSITQAALNSYVSSLGAGLAVVDSLLQQLRAGILTQNVWCLPSYQVLTSNGLAADLFGVVIDMGVTNLRRPQYLALQLANSAIANGPTMLQTVHSGADPTWDQPLVNTVQLAGAHYLQSFAFSNGSTTSVIVFNLERSSSLPVTFSGANAPSGSVQIQQLTSAEPTDTNEAGNVVAITSNTASNFNASTPFSLPPYSMTVLTWTNNALASVTPSTPAPVISSVNATNVTSTSATITWTTDQPATDQVEYGLTTSYGSLSALSSSLVTSHSVTLTGLSPSITYNYAALSANSSGLQATSSNLTFTTAAVAVSVPSVPSSPAAVPVATVASGGGYLQCRNGDTSCSAPLTIANSGDAEVISIVFCSNNTCTSTPNCTVTASDGTNTYTPVPNAQIANVSANKTEYLNMPVFSAANVVAGKYELTFTITGPGCSLDFPGYLSAEFSGASISSPIDPAVTATGSGIGKSFALSGAGSPSSSGELAYALIATSGAPLTLQSPYALLNQMYANAFDEATTSLSPGVAPPAVSGNIAAISLWVGSLIALTPGSTSAAAPVTSVTASSPTAPVITSVAATNITTTSATITWTTNQPSTDQVDYGTTTSYGSLSVLGSSLVTAHSVTLTGLAPSTTYDYIAISTNSAGLQATSSNFSFSTSAASTPAAPIVAPVTPGTSAPAASPGGSVTSVTSAGGYLLCNSGSTSCATPLTIANSGDAEVVSIVFCSNSLCTSTPNCTVTASDGTNTYSPVPNAQIANVSANKTEYLNMPVFSAANAAAGKYTLTFQISGPGCSMNFPGYLSAEFSGASISSPIDLAVSATGSGIGESFALSSAGSPSSSGELAYALIASSGAPLAFQSPYTLLNQMYANAYDAATNPLSFAVPVPTVSGTFGGTALWVGSLIALTPSSSSGAAGTTNGQ